MRESTTYSETRLTKARPKTQDSGSRSRPQFGKTADHDSPRARKIIILMH